MGRGTKKYQIATKREIRMLSGSRAVVRAGVRGLSCSPAIRQRALEDDHLELEPPRPAAVQTPTMMDVGTRSIFTGEHDRFREEKLEPLQVPFEEAGQPSKEIWLEMGAQGLLGVSTPAEVGGIGATFLEEAIVAEEMSYNHCASPAM